MSSSAISTQVAQLKIGNVQNQADTSAVYNGGIWSFKNSTAVTSVTITDAGNVGIGATSVSSKLDVQKDSAATNPSSDQTFPAWTSGAVLKNASATDGAYAGLSFLTSNLAGTTQGFSIVGQSTASGFSSNLLFMARTASGTTTERMRIDASGNVGIGTASPTSKLHVNAGGNYGILTMQAVNGSDIAFTSGATTISSIAVDSTAGANPTMIFRNGGTNTERMRINSTGSLLVGVTSLGIHNTVTNGFNYTPGSWLSVNATNEAALFTSQISGGILRFYLSNTGEKGSISIAPGGVAYNSTSDYRLKKDVQPMAGALAKIAALKPCTYKWKVDGSDGEGFIAHELAEVCPAAVTGEKDAVNEDGSIKAQGIDPSKLVALLTAAIQEQQAQIEALKAEVAALKAP